MKGETKKYDNRYVTASGRERCSLRKADLEDVQVRLSYPRICFELLIHNSQHIAEPRIRGVQGEPSTPEGGHTDKMRVGP